MRISGLKFFWLVAVAFSAHAATSLDVQIPSASTTGVAFSFTVTARNGAATDAAYSGTVHFTSDDAQAALPPDYTFTPGDAGMHTFSATMNRAGSGTQTANHTLTATDTSNAAVKGTDLTTVRWNDNVVRRFFIAVPASVDRTVPFQIEVHAMNASFFDVPTYTGTIRFTATRQETLPPDYTFTAADAGRHTFQVTANLGKSSFFSVHDVNDDTAFGGFFNPIAVQCPELTALASNSGPVCVGSQALLFGSANLPVIDYHWISTLGHPPIFDSHQQNPAASPGTYILTVLQANDCESSAQTVVTMHSPASPQVTLSTTALCGPENLHATITNSSEFSNLKWTTSGGTIVGGQGTPSVEIAPNSGETRVWLAIDAIETSSGCDASKFVAEVPIGSSAAVAISTAASACMGAAASASVADAGSGATYAWTINNGVITGGAQTNTIQYAANGNGDVTLHATVIRGSCSANGTAVVSVDAPAAVIENKSTGLCDASDAAIEVTLSGVPPFRIRWSDGVMSDPVDGFTATRSVSREGTYWIAQVSDANCSGFASNVVNVSFANKPQIVVSPQGATIRAGERATITVSALGAGLRYRWYEGNAGDRTKLVSFGAEPSYGTPPLSRTTSYWVDVENDCGSNQSLAAVITVSSGGGARRRAVGH